MLDGTVDEAQHLITVEVSKLSLFSTIAIVKIGSIVELKFRSNIDSCRIEPDSVTAHEPFVMKADINISSVSVDLNPQRKVFVEFVLKDIGGGYEDHMQTSSFAVGEEGLKNFEVTGILLLLGDYMFSVYSCPGIPSHETSLLPSESANLFFRALNPSIWAVEKVETVVRISSDMQDVPSLNDGAIACAVSGDARCELAEKYAPVLKFHPDERFLPRGVEGFIAQSRLVDGGLQPVGAGEPIVDARDLADPSTVRVTT